MIPRTFGETARRGRRRFDRCQRRSDVDRERARGRAVSGAGHSASRSPSHSALALGTRTRHSHAARAPGTRTRHAHPARAPGTRTRHAHAARARGTRTRHAHSARARGTRTRHAHSARARGTRTRHPHAALARGTRTRHAHAAPGTRYAARGTRHAHSAPGTRHSTSAVGPSDRWNHVDTRSSRASDRRRRNRAREVRCAPTRSGARMIPRTSAPRVASRPNGGRTAVRNTRIPAHGNFELLTQTWEAPRALLAVRAPCRSLIRPSRASTPASVRKAAHEAGLTTEIAGAAGDVSSRQCGRQPAGVELGWQVPAPLLTTTRLPEAPEIEPTCSPTLPSPLPQRVAPEFLRGSGTLV